MRIRASSVLFVFSCFALTATLLGFYVLPTDLQVYGIAPRAGSSPPLAFVPYVIVSGVCVLFLLRPDRLREAFSGLTVPLLLLSGAIAASLLSYFYSASPDLSLRRALSNGLTTISIVLALVAIVDICRAMTALYAALVATLALSYFALLAFPEASVHHVAGTSLSWDLEGAWKGAFIHKNFAGGVIMYALIAALFYSMGSPGWRSKSIFVLSAIFMTFSGSNTAILSAVSAIFLTYIVSKMRGHAIFAIVCFAVFFGILAFPLVVAVYFYPTFGIDLEGRAPIWIANIYTIGDSWLAGLGYAAVYSGSVDISAFDNFGYISRIGSHAHNGFLELAGQLGVISVFLVISYLMAGLWASFALTRLGGESRRLGLMLICMLFAGLFRSMVEPDWMMPRAHWYITVLLVLVAAQAAHVDVKRTRTKTASPAPEMRRTTGSTP